MSDTMTAALDFEAWNDPESPRVVGYRAAHMRVQAARGRASAYPCMGDCGRPAADWAYVHDDPDELSTTVNGAARHYSLDSESVPADVPPLSPTLRHHPARDPRNFQLVTHNPETKGTQ